MHASLLGFDLFALVHTRFYRVSRTSYLIVKDLPRRGQKERCATGLDVLGMAVQASDPWHQAADSTGLPSLRFKG